MISPDRNAVGSYMGQQWVHFHATTLYEYTCNCCCIEICAGSMCCTGDNHGFSGFIWIYLGLLDDTHACYSSYKGRHYIRETLIWCRGNVDKYMGWGIGLIAIAWYLVPVVIRRPSGGVQVARACQTLASLEPSVI